jgi:hypothetical protein
VPAEVDGEAGGRPAWAGGLHAGRSTPATER